MKLIKTNDLPLVGVSHNSDIKKRVFVERGRVSRLMNFSQAIFRPGQSVEFHAHETMTEVFYITQGTATFCFIDQELSVTIGDCIIIDSGELHTMKNTESADVSWLYFGIATDEDKIPG